LGVSREVAAVGTARAFLFVGSVVREHERDATRAAHRDARTTVRRCADVCGAV